MLSTINVKKQKEYGWQISSRVRGPHSPRRSAWEEGSVGSARPSEALSREGGGVSDAHLGPASCATCSVSFGSAQATGPLCVAPGDTWWPQGFSHAETRIAPELSSPRILVRFAQKVM